MEKKKTTKPKKAETKKEEKSPFKFSLKLPKMTRQTTIAILAVVCIAVVGAAAVFIVPSLDMKASVVKQQDRVFSITVENTLQDEAECYLKVGPLKYGDSFVIQPEETLIIDVPEGDLFAKYSTYDITLYATVGYMQEATASGVTDSAEFSILPLEKENFAIESTGAR